MARYFIGKGDLLGADHTHAVALLAEVRLVKVFIRLENSSRLDIDQDAACAEIIMRHRYCFCTIVYSVKLFQFYR